MATIVGGAAFYLVFPASFDPNLGGVQKLVEETPAALGHGVVNAASALPGFLLLGQAIPLIGPEPSGLVGGIGYTLLALALWFYALWV